MMTPISFIAELRCFDFAMMKRKKQPMLKEAVLAMCHENKNMRCHATFCHALPIYAAPPTMMLRCRHFSRRDAEEAIR